MWLFCKLKWWSEWKQKIYNLCLLFEEREKKKQSDMITKPSQYSPVQFPSRQLPFVVLNGACQGNISVLWSPTRLEIFCFLRIPASRQAIFQMNIQTISSAESESIFARDFLSRVWGREKILFLFLASISLFLFPWWRWKACEM